LTGAVVLTLAALPCAPAAADSAPLALRGVSDPERDPLVTCREGEGECFTLLGVSVEGASVFSQAQLSSLFAEFLTREVSAQDLARIAQRITDHYRSAGYFLSRAEVPVQPPGGIAHINVIEGRISEVIIDGEGARLVAPYLRSVDDAPIADLADMDRRLALASDVPGVTVRSRMEPDPNDPTSHRLIVTADLSRFEARASADNRGTENIGPIQAFARVGMNAPFGARDQFGVAKFVTPEDANEFALAEASHWYAFENGDRLRTALSVSRSRAASPSSSGNDGDGLAVSVGYERPLIRRRGRGLWIGAAFDARHQENDWFGGGGYADEMRVVRVGLRGFLEEDGRSSWVFMQASLGLDVLGASNHSMTNRSRWDADAQFAKFDFFASHYQPFGQYFGVYGALAGQWTNEPLLQSEEFAAGGLPFGRAFAYGEISGDRGVAASVEARVGTATTIDPISFVQGYLFLDGAEVWNEGGGNASLASFGGGLRFTLDNRIIAAFELAQPIDGVPYEDGDDDWRQFFSLSAEY
jgi:hemolysin activation/secretion protein